VQGNESFTFQSNFSSSLLWEGEREMFSELFRSWEEK